MKLSPDDIDLLQELCAERGVSDILYFATAIPESEVKP